MDGISLPLSKFNPRRIEVARFEFSDQEWTRIPLSDRRVHWRATERDNEKEGWTGIYCVREKKMLSGIIDLARIKRYIRCVQKI